MCEFLNVRYVDKLYHIFAGAVIAIAVGWVFGLLIGWVAGIVAGLLKELYDEYKYKGGDFFDGFATGIGAFLGTVCLGLYINF